MEESKTHVIPVSKSYPAGGSCANMNEYRMMYERSIKEPAAFWGEMARKHLSWFRPFTDVQSGGFQHGNVAWFLNGQLNISYNCLDRHLAKNGQRTAILWEGNSTKDVRRVTYEELHRETCKMANALRRLGVRKGDCVCICMPMIPEAAVAMLACARIGAPHSVVFAGFSAEALRDRIIEGRCRFVITADEAMRGEKATPLKKTVDLAIEGTKAHDWQVQTVIVFKRTGNKVDFHPERDLWWHDVVEQERPYATCESVDSEDTAFYLFTSGSTGKPKGIAHTTAGYLLGAALTHRYVFDYREGDVYACVADVGWITGHSYIVYGPLANGATTFMFESTPLFPDAGRYWDMVERHKITQFYTAPTAIRALMKYGTEIVKKYNRSSLRVLGSVGEPINPEAWRWYYEEVGDSRCPVVDTFWQTETGAIMITGLAGVTPMKAGSASLPFFGVEPVVLSEKGDVLEGNDVSGVLCFARPWPSMARTIYGNHTRFVDTYMRPYPGYYFTGDGCNRDSDGYYWITGRVDDVINVSGHRLGSAEIESALVTHDDIAEAAVIGVHHEIKGQAIFCYVTPKAHVNLSHDTIVALTMQLKQCVRTAIGAFATPDYILLTPALPKTRSGKIMRRILRKVANKESEHLGDLSTLADPQVVDTLIAEVNKILP